MLQVQDVLGLGNEARMNLPGTATGNWRFRLEPGQLTKRHAARLRELTEDAGRARVVALRRGRRSDCGRFADDVGDDHGRRRHTRWAPERHRRYDRAPS